MEAGNQKVKETNIEIGMTVKVVDIQPLVGVFVVRKHLAARRINDTGIVTTMIPGHGGGLFAVMHNDKEIAVYLASEIERYENTETKEIILDINELHKIL